MARQAGVEYPLDAVLTGAPLGDGHGVFVVPRDADVQRLETAFEQPRRERVRRLAPEHHLLPNFLDVRRRPAHDAAEHIMVSVEVLGGRVDNNVSPMVYRPEIDRAGDCLLYTSPS